MVADTADVCVDAVTNLRPCTRSMYGAVELLPNVLHVGRNRRIRIYQTDSTLCIFNGVDQQQYVSLEWRQLRYRYTEHIRLYCSHWRRLRRVRGTGRKSRRTVCRWRTALYWIRKPRTSNIVLYRLLSDARATCNDGNVVSYTLRVSYIVKNCFCTKRVYSEYISYRRHDTVCYCCYCSFTNCILRIHIVHTSRHRLLLLLLLFH